MVLTVSEYDSRTGNSAPFHPVSLMAGLPRLQRYSRVCMAWKLLEARLLSW